MLAEVGKEQTKAKFRGPFEPDQVSTEPAAFASRAFPVVQQDKIRSADDWQKVRTQQHKSS